MLLTAFSRAALQQLQQQGSTTAAPLVVAALAQQQHLQQQRATFAAKASSSSSSSSSSSKAGAVNATSTSTAVAPTKKDWAAVKLDPSVVSAIPTTTLPGQAFVGDLRSTSGLGMGDGKTTHTSKWLTDGAKSPMDYIQETEPIKVHGMVVASHGSDDPALGCPVEYISLKGTSYDKPAVCKYTGNKYYSDDWKGGGHH